MKDVIAIEATIGWMMSQPIGANGFTANSRTNSYWFLWRDKEEKKTKDATRKQPER